MTRSGGRDLRGAQAKQTGEQRDQAGAVRHFFAEAGDDALFEGEVGFRFVEGGFDHFVHGEFFGVQGAAGLAFGEVFCKCVRSSAESWSCTAAASHGSMSS